MKISSRIAKFEANTIRELNYILTNSHISLHYGLEQSLASELPARARGVTTYVLSLVELQTEQFDRAEERGEQLEVRKRMLESAITLNNEAQEWNDYQEFLSQLGTDRIREALHNHLSTDFSNVRTDSIFTRYSDSKIPEKHTQI